MGRLFGRQCRNFWVATAATSLLLLFVQTSANAEIIEVRLEVDSGWLTTCILSNCEESYRDLSGTKYLVTFAYDTDLVGPDLEPLDPGVGLYEGPFGVGASVHIDGQVPFDFSCGVVGGKMTATPCDSHRLRLRFVDASEALDPFASEDSFAPEIFFAAGGKYLDFTHGHRWEYIDDYRPRPFLDGDLVNQLPLPRPNMHMDLGVASLIHFGDENRGFEDESAWSSENSVSRDAGSPGLTLSKSLVPGCKGVIGRVTLSEPAPAGGTVVTVSDTLASTKTPATIKIREGKTSNYFTISTTPVALNEDGMVSVSIGSAMSDQPLTVRPMGISAVKLSPTTVVGGHDSTGTATLECDAGPGPVTVELSSSNAAVAEPISTTVVVPQGLRSETFTVATNPVLKTSNAMITGEASVTTKSRRLKVVPAAEVAPKSLKFGGVAVGQTSGALTTVLGNKGTVPFTVDNISLTGSYASWYGQTNNCPASLDPGSSCTISVTFTPSAALSKSARLTISTSATSTPLKVLLSGTGL